MRLIDADALREEHCEGCASKIQEGCKTDPVCASLLWVNDAPTIDPASLRPKGEWIDGQCSNCGYQAKIREIVPHWDGGFITIYENDNFCPNCGADMRKETHNEC